MTLNEILSPSHLNKQKVIIFFEENPEQKKHAIDLMTSNQEPQNWRAAWMIGYFVSKKDSSLVFDVDLILTVLPFRKDGHQRELLKIIMQLSLSDEQEGRLFDCCMTIWETVGKSPSVRITAFAFLIQILRKFPELRNEIDFLMQPQYVDALTPGVRKTFERLVDKL